MIYIPPLKKSKELMKLMMLILKLKLSMTKKLPFKKKKNSSNKDYKKSMTSEKKLPVYSNKFKMKISVTKKFPATLTSFLITLHLMQEPEIMSDLPLNLYLPTEEKKLKITSLMPKNTTKEQSLN